jgi:tetratricopeptide (TPR) repeat protein
MKKYFYFLSLLCFFILANKNSCSQGRLIDSLRKELNAATEDSMKIHYLSLLSEQVAYANLDSFFLLTNQLIHLSKKGMLDGDDNYKKVMARGLINAYNNLGSVYTNLGKTDSASFLLDTAFKMAFKFRDFNNAVVAVNNIGQLYAAQGKFEYSMRLFKVADRFSSFVPNKQKMFIKSNIATINIYLNNIKESIRIFNEISKMQKNENDWEGYASTNNNLGFIYINNIGNKDSAIYFLNEALEGFKHTNQKKQLANVYLNLGAIAEYKADLKSASENYFHAMSLLENQGPSPELCAVYNNLGHLFGNMKNKEKNYFYLKKACAVAELLGEKIRIVGVYNNLASTYEADGDLLKAEEFFLKSKKIAEELGDKKSLLFIFSNLGNLFNKISDKKAFAKDYFIKAIEIGEQNGFKKDIGTSLINLGVYYLDQKMYKEAESVFSKSYEIAKKHDYLKEQSFATHGLYRVYFNTKKFEKSIEFLELHNKLEDSLLSANSKKDILEKESKYMYQLKEAKLLAEQEKKELFLQQERQKDKYFKNSLIAGMIIMLIISGLAYRSYMIKKKANKVILEQKREVELKNEEIKKQKHIVEEKQKEIIDSITYARRIQRALITNEHYISKVMKILRS